MTMPHRRRIGSSIAALTLVTGLATGCTAGDWRYEAPPAAGIVQDSGAVKARNVMLVADQDGKGLILGSLFSSEKIELLGVAVAGEQSDGSFGEPVTLELSSDITVAQALMFGGKDSIVEGADLVPGMLAAVAMKFSDGSSLQFETVVVSSEETAYSDAWDEAQN